MKSAGEEMTIDKFIGIPFQSHGRTFAFCDCWGLVWLWYFHIYDVRLPQLLEYSDSRDAKSISDIVSAEKSSWTPVKEPRQGDVVVIAIGGKETHVGIYLHGNRMLHAFAGTASCIESLSSPKWSSRISGYYRNE